MRVESGGDEPSSQLLDHWGRVAADLRLSVTDRCNLRCSYCLPEAADSWITRQDLLTPALTARFFYPPPRSGD